MKSDPTIIPVSTSTDQEWIDWFDSLHSYFGKKVAVQLWSAAWAKRGSESSDANTNALRTYMNKQGIVVDSGILSHIVDLGEDVGDYIGDFFKLGKYMAYGVAGIILLSLLGITIGIIKNPKGAAKTAGKVAVFGSKAALL